MDNKIKKGKIGNLNVYYTLYGYKLSGLAGGMLGDDISPIAKGTFLTRNVDDPPLQIQTIQVMV